MTICTHMESSEVRDAPADVAGCEECLQSGQRWVALRMCETCGHIGCCDSSEGRHATVHHEATAHPVMRSVMPGEAWRWCYVDELMAQPGA
jgi:CPA1 family monovalent cation:H+ antiporter